MFSGMLKVAHIFVMSSSDQITLSQLKEMSRENSLTYFYGVATQICAVCNKHVFQYFCLQQTRSSTCLFAKTRFSGDAYYLRANCLTRCVYYLALLFVAGIVQWSDKRFKSFHSRSSAAAASRQYW